MMLMTSIRADEIAVSKKASTNHRNVQAHDQDDV